MKTLIEYISSLIPTCNRFFITGLCMLILNTTVLADSNPIAINKLTESQVVENIMQADDIVARMQARLKIVEGQYESVKKWPVPEFEFEQSTTENLGNKTQERSIVLKQKLIVSGQRGLEIKAAKKALQATRLLENSKMQRLRFQLKLLFYQVYYWQLKSNTYQKWLNQLEQLEAIIRKRKRAGDVSGYHVQRIYKEKLTLQASLQTALAQYRQLKTEMYGMMQTPANTSARLKGILLPPTSEPLAHLLEQVNQNQHLQSLALMRDSYNSKVRAQKRQRLPELELSIGKKESTEDAISSDGPIVGLSFKLPLASQDSGKVQSYYGQELESRANYQILKRKLHHRTTSLYYQAKQNRLSAFNFKTTGEAVAYRLVRIATTSYRSGNMGILGLVDAYRNALDSELKSLELQLVARRTYLNLYQTIKGYNHEN